MEREYAKNDLMISAVLFIVGAIIGVYGDIGSNAIQGALGGGIIIGGLRYSWQFLNFITPNIFLIMPLIGWVIFFGIKFALTLVISPFAFIIKTLINIFKILRRN